MNVLRIFFRRMTTAVGIYLEPNLPGKGQIVCPQARRTLDWPCGISDYNKTDWLVTIWHLPTYNLCPSRPRLHALCVSVSYSTCSLCISVLQISRRTTSVIIAIKMFEPHVGRHCRVYNNGFQIWVFNLWTRLLTETTLLVLVRRYASYSHSELFGFVTHGLKKQVTLKLLYYYC